MAMIVVTGAAGFIGSHLAAKLNELGYNHLVLVDDFSREPQRQNWEAKKYFHAIDRMEFPAWLELHADTVEFVFHIGARTDTAEFDKSLLATLNVDYSKAIWQLCTARQVPLIYASSAATYGNGEHGYSDAHEGIAALQPLNPYGDSKQIFDLWVLEQVAAGNAPFFWAGLKFFNVYGPNEYHKGRMASVVFHAYNQIVKTGAMQLFRSHNPAYENGGQMRDFVYVKDVVDVMLFLMETRKDSAIYNMGSGTARPFIDLTTNVFAALGKSADISYIDTPVDIRDKYQYFTEADMSKIRKAGYTKPFTTLEDGVEDYVKNYLLQSRVY